MQNFIQDFGFLFLVVVAICFVVKMARQPIIVGYVLSGLIFSLYLAGDNFDGEQVIILSELGITFLLFLMGLEFDLKSLKYLGKDILITSAVQSLLFFLLAFSVASFSGFAMMERIYLSTLFMFGSTLLVAKWLEDKKETTTLHGKIILGTLIIQDVIAILALSFIGVLQERSLFKIALAPIEGITLLFIGFVLAKYGLNIPLKFASRYPELLFVSSLGVCFLFVEIALLLGYSATIGAFVGGITLANTIYKHEISSRLRPLINFFNMLFFVGLGFQLKFGFSMSHLFFILLLVPLSLFIKPVITYITLRMKGYDIKTSFTAGIYLGQLSEFGIIIIAAGVFGGVIPAQMSGLGIMLVIATMILSSYFIKYDRQIYRYLEGYLYRFDRAVLVKKDVEHKDVDCHVLFFGYHDIDSQLLSKMKSMNKSVMVVENDPESINILKKEGIPYMYNSVSSPDFFGNTVFLNTELVISCLLDADINKMIIRNMKKDNRDLVTIVAAKTLKDAMELYEHDADYVLYQNYLNEQHVSVLLDDYATDINKLVAKKMNDIGKFREKEQKRKNGYEETKQYLFRHW
ncbi:MAG: cation:proton antiporter [archaeon]